MILKRARQGVHERIGPNQARFTSVAIDLHYEATLDSGEFTQPVDLRPARVQNAQFDGWAITNGAGWQFLLGQPADKTGDGWLGYGRRGHWLLMRLQRVAYVHWPTATIEDIGGAPTYNRANLSQQGDSIELGGETFHVRNRVTWAGIWATPGDGDLSMRWIAEGEGLKGEIVINQAGRDWIAANRPPATPANETFFTFVFEVDPSDIPQVIRGDIIENWQGDFEDNGEPVRLKDGLGNLLALLPLDHAYVEDDPETFLTLRKRFFARDGKYYLVIGARVDRLASLPEGNLVFDPTFTAQPDPTAEEDTFLDDGNPNTNYGNNFQLYAGNGDLGKSILIRFDVSSIDPGATVDNASLQLTASTTLTPGTTTAYSLHSNVSDWDKSQATWNIYKTGSSWPGTSGARTADTDYESGALGTGTRPNNQVGAQWTIPLTASRIQGWLTGSNYGLKLVNSVPLWVYAGDYATTPGYRPKLTINYTYNPPDPARAVAATKDPIVHLSSTTAVPATAKAVAATKAPTVLLGSQPPTLLSYRGDVLLFSQSAQLSAALLTTKGTYWVLTTSANANETISLTARRYKSFLVPQ